MLQRSSAWHDWRGKGIGSSDAPIIMGCTRYSTPRKLYLSKRGHGQADDSHFSNPAIQRGVKFEPMARALYELKHNRSMSEALFESPMYPFLRASLDGFNFEEQIILEIKVPSSEVFSLAKEGQVDDYYIWQLEHQLLVTGAKAAHFYCVKVDDKSEQIIDDALVVYTSVPEKRAQLIDKELEFWNMVQQGIEPALTDDDQLERSEPEVVEVYKKIRDLKEKISSIDASKEDLEKSLESLKEQAVQMMKHTNEVAAGIQIRRVVTKTFDKKKAKAAGVDINQYESERVSYQLRMLKA